ncbi:MAG TPA: RNA polymerase sigma factor [Flavobacteriales bacterium]|nr:RNA polymerase sigma factor [Flavobacteriales bacterium]
MVKLGLLIVNSMTDEELIEGCKARNPLSQKQLYEKYSRKMMGVCMRYMNNRDEAEDVLQDGFVKVFEKIGSFQSQGSFEGWIRRIFVNTALDSIRRNKEHNLLADIDQVGYALDSGYNVESTLNAEELLNILNNIPTGYKVVFNMFVIEGYSHKEIAEELGVSESTSKTQFLRAKAYLVKAMQKQKMID